MSPRPPLRTVLDALKKEGFDQAEVYAKSGRSRSYVLSGSGSADRSTSRVFYREEAGWAVRAGMGERSFFYAATGQPTPETSWPEPAPGVLQLPSAPTPGGGEGYVDDPEQDAPLLSEREGMALLSALESHLAEELPGARILRATLDDGASESHLRSSRAVQASWRHRLAALEVEAVGPAGGVATVVATVGKARELNPAPLARRIADRLTVGAGKAVDRDRGEILLAPAVAARVLAGLLPLLVGSGAAARARRLIGATGRLASEALTVIDDGTLPGGALRAPVDGEGIPTRRWTLIDAGRFRRPMLSRVEGSPGVSMGCLRRPSWRHPPQLGPGHLFVTPDPETSVASLLARVARGYYLIDAPEPGHFDVDGDFFSLPVRGFALLGGQARYPVAGMRLMGAISALLRGIKARGRDLSFLPLAGMVGSPTLLVTGLEMTGG